MTNPLAALHVSDIVLRRDGTEILRGASLRIDNDQRWVIIGANGSGKTSLMRVMALYDHPTNGRGSRRTTRSNRRAETAAADRRLVSGAGRSAPP